MSLRSAGEPKRKLTTSKRNSRCGCGPCQPQIPIVSELISSLCPPTEDGPDQFAPDPGKDWNLFFDESIGYRTFRGDYGPLSDTVSLFVPGQGSHPSKAGKDQGLNTLASYNNGAAVLFETHSGLDLSRDDGYDRGSYLLPALFPEPPSPVPPVEEFYFAPEDGQTFTQFLYEDISVQNSNHGSSQVSAVSSNHREKQDGEGRMWDSSSHHKMMGFSDLQFYKYFQTISQGSVLIQSQQTLSPILSSDSSAPELQKLPQQTSDYNQHKTTEKPERFRRRSPECHSVSRKRTRVHLEERIPPRDAYQLNRKLPGPGQHPEINSKLGLNHIEFTEFNLPQVNAFGLSQASSLAPPSLLQQWDCGDNCGGNFIGSHRCSRDRRSLRIACLGLGVNQCREFRTRIAFNNHYNTTHLATKFDCPHKNCKRVGTEGFSRVDNLIHHRRSVHKEYIPLVKFRFGPAEAAAGKRTQRNGFRAKRTRI